MPLRMVTVGAFGAVVLTAGLILGFAKLRHYYPGLIMIVGFVLLLLFLLMLETAWSRTTNSSS